MFYLRISRYSYNKSFALFITVKTIAKLTPERKVINLKYKFKKLAVVVQVLQTMQDLVISRCWLAEDGKEMYKEL